MKIFPQNVEAGPDVFDQLRAEYSAHMKQAQELPPAAGGDVQ